MPGVWKRETLLYSGQTFYGLLKQEAESRNVRREQVHPYGVRGRTAEGRVYVKDSKLVLTSGESLEWEGFRRWKEDEVRKACLFVVCLEQQMPDAYRDCLEKQYKEETCACIALSLARNMLVKRYEAQWQQEGMKASVILGPGYYGMDVEAAEIICQVTDAGQIGVSYENGMLNPMFSLTGLILQVPEGKSRLEHPCRYCKGAVGGCRWCEMRKEKEW